MLLFLLKTAYLSLLFLMTLSVFLALSQQRRLLSMVGVLLQLALALLFLHFEYAAFIVVIVYVGAIAVLFLFVIMLVSLSRPASSRRYALAESVLPWAFASLLLLALVFTIYADSGVWFEPWAAVLGGRGAVLSPVSLVSFLAPSLFSSPLLTGIDGVLATVSGAAPSVRLPNPELEQLGGFLWTEGGLLVVLGGLVLLVSVVGSVGLLRGVLRSNLQKRARLLGSSTATGSSAALLLSSHPNPARFFLGVRRRFCSSSYPPLKNPLRGRGLDRLFSPGVRLRFVVAYRHTFRLYLKACREATQYLPYTTYYIFEYLTDHPHAAPETATFDYRKWAAFFIVWAVFFVGVFYHGPVGVFLLWARRLWRFSCWTAEGVWDGVCFLFDWAVEYCWNWYQTYRYRVFLEYPLCL